MRAVRLHSFGDPAVLRVDDIGEPADPAGDQILVRVDASSVNGTDLGLRRGDLRIVMAGRLPVVMGFDVAGEVLGCGPAVTAFSPGDRVTALLGHGGGGQSRRVVLRQGRAALAPSTVSAVHAAALPLAGLTALQALHGRAAPWTRPGARVLVIGASGGIGAFAVQLAALAGAHVTAVTGADRGEFVAALGADEVLGRGDLAAPAERWDLVLDTPGRLSFGTARPLLAERGVLVSTRPLGPDLLRSVVPAPWRGRRFAPVMTRARSQDLAHLAALVDAGRLRIPLDRVFPMGDVAAAHRHAESGVRGKVVIDVTG